MSDLIHFITLHWTEDRPYLQYRPDPHAPAIQHMELVAGEPLAVMVGTVRACIGYYDFVQKQKVPCPERRKLGNTYFQCFQCQRQEVTYYTFTGFAADPLAAQAYLDTQTHQAYLNIFGHHLLKVGVASEGRKLRRALEQGALASLFFAQANGTDIRDLERYISRELHVKDKVTTLQKVKRLAERQTDVEAQAVLREAAQRIMQQLPAHFQRYLLPHAEFHFHQDKYQLDLQPAAAEINLIRHVAARDTYAGLVRGVAGNLLILEAGDRRLYVVPMKRLQGYMLAVEPALNNMRMHHEPQTVRWET